MGKRLLKWVGILLLLSLLAGIHPVLPVVAIAGYLLWRYKQRPLLLSNTVINQLPSADDEEVEYEHIKFRKGNQHYTTVKNHIRRIPDRRDPSSLLPENGLSPQERDLVRNYRREQQNTINGE